MGDHRPSALISAASGSCPGFVRGHGRYRSRRWFVRNTFSKISFLHRAPLC